MPHVLVQLSKNDGTGDFHDSKNGIDEKIAKHWEQAGKCRIVKDAGKPKAAATKPAAASTSKPAGKTAGKVATTIK